MNYYEETEPRVQDKVDVEKYEELKEELEKEQMLRIDTDERLNNLVETIKEFGNKYDFETAFEKTIEYMKEMKFVWKYSIMLD